jgi:hypothetical protein
MAEEVCLNCLHCAVKLCAGAFSSYKPSPACFAPAKRRRDLQLVAAELLQFEIFVVREGSNKKSYFTKIGAAWFSQLRSDLATYRIRAR